MRCETLLQPAMFTLGSGHGVAAVNGPGSGDDLHLLPPMMLGFGLLLGLELCNSHLLVSSSLMETL